MNRQLEDIQGGEHTYLNEFMTDLPNNVLLNKRRTGCGATTLSLSNEEKYVVCLPFAQAIICKATWCLNEDIPFFDVCGECTNRDVIDIRTFTGKKIIVTFDSLGKVTEVLKQRSDFDEWKLNVDESHQLLKSAGYRLDAIETVLRTFRDYKRYVFVTATPIKNEHLPPQLKNIPRVKVSWSGQERVKINHFCYRGKCIDDCIVSISNKYIKRFYKERNAHIFINSVTAIVRAIKTLERGGKCFEDDIRVVCASNDKNRKTLAKIGYEIDDVGSEAKKVNFYTSTAFEGSDVFDENGKTYIITDGKSDYTKIDVTTTLPQIIGRIRDSKYKDEVELIYTPSPYFSMTEEEFEIEVRRKIGEAERIVIVFKEEKDWNNEEGHLRYGMNRHLGMIREHLNNPYLRIDDKQDLMVNEMVWYSEMNNYVTINETYYVSKNGLERGITDGVKENNGTEYNYQPSKDYDVKGADRIMIGKTAKHIDLCKQYSRHIRRTNNPETRFLINNIFNKYSEIIDAYEKIGMTGFINCSYQISKMKKEMNPKVSYDEKKHSISNHIKLKKGDWYSKTALKDMIQESYSLDDLKATAKATDIKLRYVTISRKGKCNDTNMRVNGFVIIGSNR